MSLSKDVVYGATASAISLPTSYGVMRLSHAALEQWGVKPVETQNYFRYYESFSKLSNPFLKTLLKAVAVAYAIIIIPIMEEWFFRGVVYDWLKDNSQETIPRVFRVVSNALIFGAFHFSFFYGWGNLSILVVSTIAGMVFATLREITGNVRASTIAHMINNTVVLLTV